jgi:hypothetical protein
MAQSLTALFKASQSAPRGSWYESIATALLLTAIRERRVLADHFAHLQGVGFPVGRQLQ